jgi:hypothetical protein
MQHHTSDAHLADAPRAKGAGIYERPTSSSKKPIVYLAVLAMILLAIVLFFALRAWT